MKIRPVIILSILLLCALFTIRSVAQPSVVFLPVNETENELGESERPHQTLRLLNQHFSLQSFQPEQQSPSDFPNINISSFLLADQNEPSLAINPTDPNNIIIGCNDYRSDSSLWYFVSTNGGVSWDGAPHRSNWQFAAIPFDPAVTFNRNGTAFFCYERAASFGLPYAINDVVSFRSTTKGASWDIPIQVIKDSNAPNSASQTADKGYVCIDNSSISQFKDRIYIAWVIYEAGKGKIVLSYSTNDGVSWTAPKAITASANFQCPIPVCGLNGDIYISYQDIDPTHRQIHFVRSTDGGNTFSSDVIVSGYSDLGRLYPAGKDNAHPVIKGHLRVNSFPSIAIDRSTLHPGRIYMTWAAKDNTNRAHIYLSTSDNRGTTWSAPSPIEADASTHPTDKFFPWIAIDNTNGDIGVVCYDSRNDSLNNELVDAYMLFSRDGGANFTPMRLTYHSFDPKVSSSIDSLGDIDTLQFLGDYLSLDGTDKRWYPTWADARVGYDQDLYVAIVKPYAPTSPKVFTATEQNTTHFALLNWQYDPKSNCGIPLGAFQFRLRREDGIVDVLLPSTDRAYTDILANQTSNHTYSIQVVTQDGDTSTRAYAKYYPRAIWEAKPPELLSGETQTNGFTVTIKVPSENTAGLQVTNLDQFIYVLDDTKIDTVKITDQNRGKTYQRTFFTSAGYHKLQLVIATKMPEGDTVLSVRSDARWLYAGDPRIEYTENFSFSRDIFSIYGWDTTSINAPAPSVFINDSLPTIPYLANTNSWFCLPAIQISDNTKTLEFDHIASVAAGDSAILEFSTDDGVHFDRIRYFDLQTNPDKWHSTVTTSTIVHENIDFKHFIGSNVIVRYRLATHSTNGDGWFITNIKFSDKLGVRSLEPVSTNTLQILTNPIHPDQELKAKLTTSGVGKISISIYDMLGRKCREILDNKIIIGGEYLIETEVPEEAGCYKIECREETPHGIIYHYGKYIVLP